MNTKRTNRKIRLAILISVLTITTTLGFAHINLKQNAPVGIDALCPFGAIESAYTLIYTGTMLNRLAASSFILFAAVLVTALLFRRSFCGLICPLGALQELSANLGKKIFGRQLTVPSQVDRPARLIKYPVLILVIFFTARAGEMVIRPYDPWIAYHHLTSADILTEFKAGFVILLLTLIGSLLFNRVFCKYLCPMGAFLAPFNRFGWFGITRNDSTCQHCKACNNACPVQIDVAGGSRINNPECINCNECVNVCPAGDTLSVRGPKNANILGERLVLGIIPVIFILIISATTLSGNFTWKNPSLQTTVEAAGRFDPALIKGRMTLQEVSQVSGIPARAFEERFKIEKADFNVPIRDIAGKYGFSETEEVRAFVREYLAAKK